MKYINTILISVFMLLVQGQAHAIEKVFTFGYGVGGDGLFQLGFSDGSTATLNANQGMDFAFGIESKHGADEKLATQVTYGYTFGGEGASNGGIEWSNTKIEVIEFYRTSNKYRVGAGLSYHMSPKTSGTGLAEGDADMAFSNAMGFVLVAELNDARNPTGLTVGLRYTDISYSNTTYNGIDTSALGIKVSGSSIGLYIGRVW